MRKANNSKTNKQKSADRKIKKVSDFIDKSSSVYTVLYVFKENVLKHKQAWESSIKNDDDRYNCGNYFKTKKEARKVIESLK